MKVILTQDVVGLGERLEARDVADGYARNYLLPRGLAVVASRGAAHQVEKLIEEKDRKRRKEEEKAGELLGRLEGQELRIVARGGASGHLYGEVTSQRIAEALSSQFGMEIERRHVKVSRPIRTVGRHSVTVRLAQDLSAEVAVEVTAESP
jgi:large subunit ribosomal protein L9